MAKEGEQDETANNDDDDADEEEPGEEDDEDIEYDIYYNSPDIAETLDI